MVSTPRTGYNNTSGKHKRSVLVGTTYNLISVSKTEAVGTPGRGSLATSQAYGKHKRSVLQGPVTITQVENTSGQYSWVQPTTSQVYRKQKRLVLPGEGRLQPHKRMGQSPTTSQAYGKHKRSVLRGSVAYNITSVRKTQAVGTPRIAYNIINVAKTQTVWTPRGRLQSHKRMENTSGQYSEGLRGSPTSSQAYGKHKRSVLRGSPRVAYKLTSVSKTQAVSTPWVAYNLTSVAKTQTV